MTLKKHWLALAAAALVAIGVCIGFLVPWPGTAPVSAEPEPVTASRRFTEYRNDLFGFIMRLPEDWRGHQVVTRQWEGENRIGGKNISGPELLLRHPEWTQQEPWEDVVVMVFTHAEWLAVQAGDYAVNAAPATPAMLGRNRRYVFALPARHNHTYAMGWEEIARVLAGDAFRGF